MLLVRLQMVVASLLKKKKKLAGATQKSVLQNEIFRTFNHDTKIVYMVFPTLKGKKSLILSQYLLLNA